GNVYLKDTSGDFPLGLINAGGGGQIDIARTGIDQAEREVPTGVLEIDVSAGSGGGGKDTGVNFERRGHARADRGACARDGEDDVVGADVRWRAGDTGEVAVL